MNLHEPPLITPPNTATGVRNPLATSGFTLGAFFWDYSVGSYSGIRITEHTEYQFPEEQTLCYSESRIAGVTKIKVMRLRKSGCAHFLLKDRRQLPKEHNYP